MSDVHTPDDGGRDAAEGRVVCPVCGVEGDERGLGAHLVYEHGWDEEGVPAGADVGDGRGPDDR